MKKAPKKRLILSIHDVTPRHFERLKQIDAFLKEQGIGSRYSMLVVPDFWHQWPLEAHSEFQSWLRARAGEGVEMILHGFYHRDESVHSTAAARFKARALTAREGEFLGLSRAESLERLQRGRDLLSSILGRKIEGFIAPAWLYGAGAREALQDLGFDFAEDHWSVWSPSSGKTLATSPVISYASRSEARILSSLVWSRLATMALRPLDAVRLAIHPHDFDVDRLVTEIARATTSLLTHREPVLYRDLAAQGG
jgi:hypothetical protein